MSPEVKQIFRVTALTTLGLFVGSLISGLIPESVTGLVKGTAQAFASGVVSMGEASTFALTIGLIAVCAALFACCFVVEVAALLLKIRKIRRKESTDGPDRMLTGLQRVDGPLALGGMGGSVIAVLAFEARWTEIFAAVPWIGPTALLVLVSGTFIKTSLKKKMLDQLAVGTKGKD